MDIKNSASAGSLESSDVLVTIERNNEEKNNIVINSPFIRQFGNQMKKIALKVLSDLKISHCTLIIQDQGAIDEVLIARIVTALQRSLNQIISY